MKRTALFIVALLAIGGRGHDDDGNDDPDAGVGDILDDLRDVIKDHDIPKEEPKPNCPDPDYPFEDCAGNCFKSIAMGGCKVYGLPDSEDCNKLVGDFVCDQGQRILGDGELGPNLDCEKFQFDSGDCNCAPERTMTCSGYCLSDEDCKSARWSKDTCKSWMTDNVCDYGQRISDQGITMHFECSKYNFDNYACDETASCDDFDLTSEDAIAKACPAPDADWVNDNIQFPTQQPTSDPTSNPTLDPTAGCSRQDEIQDIEDIVKKIESTLNDHAAKFDQFLNNSSTECKDNYYHKVLVTDTLSLFCDELDPSAYPDDCASTEAKTECCKTCCEDNGICA